MKMSESTKYLKLLSFAVIPALLLGCMFRTYQHHVPIDEGPSAVVSTGGATVTGEVTIKAGGGEARSGSDSTIYLIPATAYATEWFDHYVVKGEKVDGMDPRSFPSARAAPVDREGRFEFRNVSAGAYYLTCNVHYRRPGFRLGSFNFGFRTLKNVQAYANVNVDAGRKSDIAVTRPPS